MTPSVADPHATAVGTAPAAAAGKVLCYICETDVTPEVPREESEQIEESGKKKKKRRKEEGDAPKRGLVELRSEGTGFAGGGKSVVDREGVVFQC